MRYALRDPNSKNWTDAELLAAINHWYEVVYKGLVDDGNELVRTGSGTITTVDGTETYALSDNSMGDFWAPHRVWIAGYEALDQVSESKRYDYEQSDASLSKGQPLMYYVEGDNIGFIPTPSDAYTVRIKYYPNFVPLASTAASMPLRNLFNQQIEQGAVLTAKTSRNQNANIESAMLQLHQDIAFRISTMRQKQTVQFQPRFK
jgi:hypothetical protein